MIFARISSFLSRSNNTFHRQQQQNLRGLISTQSSSSSSRRNTIIHGGGGPRHVISTCSSSSTSITSRLLYDSQVLNSHYHHLSLLSGGGGGCCSPRLFSNQASHNKNKNYENYYPSGTVKGTVRNVDGEKSYSKRDGDKSDSKGDGHKSGSQGDSGKNDDGKQFQNLLPSLLFFAFVLSSIFLNPQEKKQISFQEFKNKLLEPGLVDHIVVTNKSVAKVYVKSSVSNTSQISDEASQGPNSDTGSSGKSGYYKYYFNIGSVETFEEKLEEAQKALGIDPHNYVPVMYSDETNWLLELLRFTPTLFLLGTLYFMGRRMQINVPGGKGARGIFNIGKAQVTKLDKNSKNKESLLYFYLFVLVILLFSSSMKNSLHHGELSK